MSASMMKMIAMSSVNSVWNMPELKEYIYAYDPTYKNQFKQCLDELPIHVGRRISMNQFKQCIQEVPIIAERYSIYTILRRLVGTQFPSAINSQACRIITWNGQGIIERDDEWVLGNFTAQSIYVQCQLYNINDDPDEPYIYEALYSGIRYDQETELFEYDDVEHFPESEEEVEENDYDY